MDNELNSHSITLGWVQKLLHRFPVRQTVNYDGLVLRISSESTIDAPSALCDKRHEVEKDGLHE